MKWILNHLRLFAGIIIFGVTVVIVGVTILVSYTSYQSYEKKYYQNDLEMRSLAAAAPKVVEINDNFKSKYKIVNFIEENNAPDSEGKFEVKLELKEKSFADIVVLFNSDTTEDLLSLMNIKVNDSLVEESGLAVNKESEGEEWHNLVMRNFALPEGDLKFVISPISNKVALPGIQKITFYTSADANIVTE